MQRRKWTDDILSPSSGLLGMQGTWVVTNGSKGLVAMPVASTCLTLLEQSEWLVLNLASQSEFYLHSNTTFFQITYISINMNQLHWSSFFPEDSNFFPWRTFFSASGIAGLLMMIFLLVYGDYFIFNCLFLKSSSFKYVVTKHRINGFFKALSKIIHCFLDSVNI